jgi:hypothetical protein
MSSKISTHTHTPSSSTKLKPLTSLEKSNAFNFIFYSLLVMILTGVVAYYCQNYARRQRGENEQTPVEFLNNGPMPSLKTILVGMIFGFAFGFIDNSSLWLGMDYLGPIFARVLPGNLTNAGLGNAYGDFLGSSFGTFLALIFKSFIQVDNIPIWADCLGVSIGCLLGVLIPRYLSGKI